MYRFSWSFTSLPRAAAKYVSHPTARLIARNAH